MKKKFYLFAAVASLMLAACSGDDATGVTENVKDAPQTGAIEFDTYSATATRAGQTDIMTTSTLQSEGFGVFAYETTGDYSPTAKPDFMYNQLVKYSSTAWEYAPLKFWPNNTGNDMHNATGAATTTPVEKVSFFAYAPYVNNTATEPSVTEGSNQVGIIALSANNAAGDPKVSYRVTTIPSRSVDLLWGVAQTSGFSYQSVASASAKDVTVGEGLPLKNLVKPNKDQKIKFLFQHALARLGMTVVAAVDQVSQGGILDPNETKIVIESITITDVTSGGGKLATTADLNLNNGTKNVAKWENTDKTTALNFTINNGNELESSLQWVYAFDGSKNTINNVESFKKEGVLTYEKPVIGNNKYLMIIPTEGNNLTNLDVNIKYYVMTKDSQLADQYSVVKNDVTKQVSVDFDNGMAYNLKLILGLTSVKIDAEVANWAVGGTTDVDLPKNQN